MSRPALAEFIGTFLFVFAASGAGMAMAPASAWLAPALAAGLALVAASYALGHISGGHFNPAVTLGLIAAGRFDTARAPLYIAAQVAGGVAAALVLSAMAGDTRLATGSLVANHFGGTSGGVWQAFLVECVATALLVVVTAGTMARRAAAGFAPLAIGLALAALYLVAMPVTNASLNPARSTGLALFAGTQALSQLWLFWLAPSVGGAIGGILSRALQDD